MRVFLLLSVAAAAAAQPRDGLEWAVALASRFASSTNPVVTDYAYARLGEVVCGKDPAHGAELLRQALAGLNLVTLDNFTWSGHVLPVSSYTGLFKLTTAAARKCDPSLEGSVNLASAQGKMDEERRLANTRLSQARGFIKDNPDRAAQLMDGAIASSLPGVLDMSMLGLALSELRDRAPDLSDDLFPQALAFISDAAAPDPSLLMELGKFLFTSPQYVSADDKLELSETTQIGNTQVANFRATRSSTDTDEVRDYIDATIKVVTAVNDPNYDPAAAYAVASQMLSKAQDIAPDLADTLQAAINQIAAQVSSQIARIQSAVGGPGAPDPEAGEGPRRRDRAVGQTLSAAASGKFDDARRLMKGIDDFSVRTQVSRLVDFAEAAALAGKKDIQGTIAIATTLRPGIKRCLIDCAMQAAMEKEAAISQFQFAAKETEGLAAEQRAYLWAAIASSIVKLDSETFFFALNQMVVSLNDAYTNPHKGRFDPKSVRQIYNPRVSTSTDAALVLFNRRGLVEVVDSGAGRHSFSLKAPGVPAYRLTDVIRGAADVDPSRIEGILLGLSSEAERVNALVALAALRLGVN